MSAFQNSEKRFYHITPPIAALPFHVHCSLLNDIVVLPGIVMRSNKRFYSELLYNALFVNSHDRFKIPQIKINFYRK